MKTSVVILAAGPAWRGWTEDAPKQLALIAGEPLILRTLRQLKERGYDEEVIVVTHNRAIQSVVPKYFEPAICYWRTETIAATQELWSERTIVLNGDAIFSPAAMDAAVAAQEPIVFIGIGDKLHKEAFVFTDRDLVLRAAKAATDMAYAGEAGSKPECVSQNTPRQWGGQYMSWGFYRVLSGVPPVLARHFNPKIHRIVKNDYTCDIDTPQQYRKFLSKHRWARAKMVYLDNKHKHMIWQSYSTHPPISYVSRKQALLCHFMGHVPRNNRTPFIKEIEHVLFTPGLSKDYAAMLEQALRIEQEFHSENCKGIFVFSDSALRQVARYIDTSGIEDKLHIVLPAYPDQPDKIYKDALPFTILTISNKFWGKGIPLAIETFRKLRKTYGRAVRMKLVCEDVPADYPLVEGLELIRVRRLDSKLRRKLYQEADVFLLLSLMQFGLVLEAMAYGVPTVSTPNCDRGGWILRGDTGFVVDPPFHHYDESFGIEWENWDQFQETVKTRFEHGDLAYMITEAVDLIEFLMQNPSFLRKMGQAAQRQQREKHSIEARNRQVRQVYADILKDLS